MRGLNDFIPVYVQLVSSDLVITYIRNDVSSGLTIIYSSPRHEDIYFSMTEKSLSSAFRQAACSNLEKGVVLRGSISYNKPTCRPTSVYQTNSTGI